jgi:hypothetical protein
MIKMFGFFVAIAATSIRGPRAKTLFLPRMGMSGTPSIWSSLSVNDAAFEIHGVADFRLAVFLLRLEVETGQRRGVVLLGIVDLRRSSPPTARAPTAKPGRCERRHAVQLRVPSCEPRQLVGRRFHAILEWMWFGFDPELRQQLDTFRQMAKLSQQTPTREWPLVFVEQYDALLVVREWPDGSLTAYASSDIINNK